MNKRTSISIPIDKLGTIQKHIEDNHLNFSKWVVALMLKDIEDETKGKV